MNDPKELETVRMMSEGKILTSLSPADRANLRALIVSYDNLKAENMKYRLHLGNIMLAVKNFLVEQEDVRSKFSTALSAAMRSQ